RPHKTAEGWLIDGGGDGAQQSAGPRGQGCAATSCDVAATAAQIPVLQVSPDLLQALLEAGGDRCMQVSGARLMLVNQRLAGSRHEDADQCHGLKKSPLVTLGPLDQGIDWLGVCHLGRRPLAKVDGPCAADGATLPETDGLLL